VDFLEVEVINWFYFPPFSHQEIKQKSTHSCFEQEKNISTIEREKEENVEFCWVLCIKEQT
jgi:hypothetical protein